MRTKGQNTLRWPKGGESHPQTQAPPLTKVPHPLVGTQVCLSAQLLLIPVGEQIHFFHPGLTSPIAGDFARLLPISGYQSLYLQTEQAEVNDRY